MSGDYTRFTFRSRKDYSSVLKQQGRVDLDADFNELIEIVDRRWRSETIDIIGHCVVPIETLDAFSITPTAIGAFDIGIGRMYVDGIQVECHGLPPEVYLADLGETRGTARVPYSNQPYLPAPLPPPLAGAANTTDLVYIDVWQREVTAIEDPSIREIALGGPDTATRVQAAWQVRVLQNVGQHACGDDIPIWNQTIAPSGGRLTTSAVAPPASDDPCIIAPSGGYRGLENRLYRVEIHATGTVGGGAPAKFKWSRNNASVASSVPAIPGPTQIEVQQIGRDEVLRFDVGNWIEITDDFREFQGLAGHMTKITAIDEANRLLTFAPAIPGSITFDASNPTRHTRVRRWDQTQNVDANGLLDVVAGPIDLEDGVRVSFSLPQGSFRIGDYWVFAARTADGSVEPLTAAPPRGILHHYCRLGFINWGATLQATTVVNCRIFWPRCDCEGHCTVTVGDGVDSHGEFTDIQAAIDALGNRGGVVCIGRGFYMVRRGLRLDDTKRNVIIRGMGPATRIVFLGEDGDAFLEMRNTGHVRLEDVYVVAFNAAAIVRITQSHDCRVTRCVLVNLPRRGADIPAAARAIELVENCSRCDILDNALLGGKAIAATTGDVTELLVRDNQALSTQAAIVIREARGLEVLRNQFRALAPGAVPDPQALTRESFDAFQQSVSAAFLAAPSSTAFQAAGVLIFAGNRVVIEHNLITAQIGVLGFLLLNARVERNDLLSFVGIMTIFGIVVKVEDNVVLAPFAGFLHAGLLVDFDCTSNEWLGLHGILFMSLRELFVAFAPILGGALAALGFPAGSVGSTYSTGAGLTSNALVPFGLVLIAKMHRNVLLSLFRGIYKTDGVVSGDVSIVDNTVSLAFTAGIELGGEGRAASRLLDALGGVVTPRHLIQGNAIAARGQGVVTSTPFTTIVGNTVTSRLGGIELDARFCQVRENVLEGLGEEGGTGTGLLVLSGRASNATIAANQLYNSRGFSILVERDVFDLTVEDNLIRNAERAGFGCRDEAVLIRRLRVARNQVEACRGTPAEGTLQFGGAISIAAAENAQLVGNLVVNNAPLAAPDLRWFAVYVEDAEDIEVEGNTVVDNIRALGQAGVFGAIGLQGVSGTIRVQNNVARNNGGMGLFIGESRHVPDRPQHALVENNQFLTAPISEHPAVHVRQIESLVFSGNQCRRERAAFFTPTAFVQSLRLTACGNQVEAGGLNRFFVQGRDVVVSANTVAGLGWLNVATLGVSRLIVTSNLAAFISAASAGVLVRGLNSPAP